MANTMFYPFEAKRDVEGNWQVQFPDIPEATVTVKAKMDVRRRAVAALEAAFNYYFDAYQPIPTPSPVRLGQDTIAVAPGIALRLLKHNEAISRTQ